MKQLGVARAPRAAKVLVFGDGEACYENRNVEFAKRVAAQVRTEGWNTKAIPHDIELRTKGWARICIAAGTANVLVRVRVADSPSVKRAIRFTYDSDKVTEDQAFEKLAKSAAAYVARALSA